MEPFRDIALVHDWLTGQRGGEQVLERMLRVFPNAHVFTLVHRRGTCSPTIERAPIHTSYLQRLPGAPHHFRRYLPLMFDAIRRLELGRYGLVLSSHHCVAAGVRTRPGQRHVSYVHSPMRYLYDQMPEYLPERGRRLWLPLARRASTPLRWLDRFAARGPERLLANSAFVRARIRAAWGREATVLPPPVDTAFFSAAASEPAGAARPRRGLICVTALRPYKRVDALVDYALASGEPLTVVGSGPRRAALVRRAPAHVRFLQGLTREALRELYAQAEAFVFAGEEDAGIAAVEAMSAGCPVVALGRGGVAEAIGTTGDGLGPGGASFGSADVASIGAALARLRRAQAAGRAPDAASLRAQAARFSCARFDAGLRAAVDSPAQSDSRSLPRAR